jgi:hypothetical protein
MCVPLNIYMYVSMYIKSIILSDAGEMRHKAMKLETAATLDSYGLCRSMVIL